MYDDNNLTLLETNILLWGRQSSGKTTLVRAFLKELSLFNTYKEHLFTYNVLDAGSETPFFSSSNQPSPTKSSEDQFVFIKRSPKSKDKALHLSCNFQHKITIRDGKGQDAIDMALGDDSNSYGISLQYFDHIIITIDATAPSQDEVIKDILRLFAILEKKPNPQKIKRCIAVCVTKKDFFEKNNATPQVFFDERFHNYSDVLINNLNPKFFTINFFSTSALGYYFDGKKRSINYNPDTGWLADELNWRPENVVSPFFWIFTKFEEHELGLKRPIWLLPRPRYIPWG